MEEGSQTHRVFIINEDGEAPFVHPKVLGVARSDQVIFVVAGENGEFTVRPETGVFRSVSRGEELPIEKDNPPKCTVGRAVDPNTAHRYVVSTSSGDEIDPILAVYE